MDRSTYISSINQSSIRGNRTHNLSTSLSVVSTSSTTATSLEVHTNVDANLCFIALEQVLTLLGSQSLLALKDINLSPREKQLIKREISSELHEFHDFVKKRLITTIEMREILHRKKHGISLVRQPFDGRQDKVTERPSRLSVGSSRRDSMRVLVTRRMHLNTLHSPSPPTSVPPRSMRFNMTHDISGIGGSGAPELEDDDRNIVSSSTPANPAYRSGSNRGDRNDLPLEAKRQYMASDEPIYLDPEEQPDHDEWTYINLVEEDYLIFLSNLFSYITK